MFLLLPTITKTWGELGKSIFNNPYLKAWWDSLEKSKKWLLAYWALFLSSTILLFYIQSYVLSSTSSSSCLLKLLEIWLHWKIFLMAYYAISTTDASVIFWLTESFYISTFLFEMNQFHQKDKIQENDKWIDINKQ